MKKRNFNRAETTKYKGYHKLLPSEEYEGYDIYYKAKKVFDRVNGKKGGVMTMSKFIKLAKINGMTNSQL